MIQKVSKKLGIKAEIVEDVWRVYWKSILESIKNYEEVSVKGLGKFRYRKNRSKNVSSKED